MRRITALLGLLLFLVPLGLAANDPGHDSLYILRSGDNVSGNYNFSNALFIHESTGYVGVGDPEPDEDLKISRDADDIVRLFIENPNSGTSASTDVTLYEGPGKFGQLSFTNTNGGLVGTAIKDNGVWLRSAGTGGISISAQSAGAAIRFYTEGNNDADEKLRITPSGRVGIGVSTPSAFLDINGSLRMRNLTSCDSIDTDANGSLVCGTDDAGSGSLWTNSSGNATYIAGNVGIGTTSPSSALEVAGDINIGEISAFKIGGVDIIRSNSSQSSLTVGESTAEVSKYRITTVGASSGENTSGNSFVGVGYWAGRNSGDDFTSIGYGAGNTAGDEYVALGHSTGNDAGDRFTALGYQSTNPSILTMPANINDTVAIGYQSAPQYDGHFVIQQSNLNVRPIIQGNFSSGNLGIGLTNGIVSNSTFDVNGSVRIRNLASCDTIDTDANGVLSCGVDASGGGSLWTNSSGNATYTAGRVGVGTTSPSTAFTVNGTSTTELAKPKAVGKISNGDGGAILDSFQHVHATERYVYLPVDGATEGLQIIDVSDPRNPVGVGQITDTASTDLTNPESVTVDGDYAYLTFESAGGLTIIDVSDPQNPTQVSHVADGDGGALLANSKDVEVDGNYAYVTSFDDDAVSILDVSDKTNPVLVGNITNSTGGALLNGATRIDVQDNKAFVTSYFAPGYTILNISDPTNPQTLGTYQNSTVLSGADDIHVQGSTVFVAGFGSDSFAAFDTTDPTTPTLIDYITDGEQGAKLDGAVKFDVAGDYAYVSAFYNGTIQVIDISNTSDLAPATQITDGEQGANLSNTKGIDVVGRYAYASGTGDNTLQVLELSGVQTPTANIGSASLDEVYVGSYAEIAEELNVGDGVTVGEGGVSSAGKISSKGDLTTQGRLGVGTSRPEAGVDVYDADIQQRPITLTQVGSDSGSHLDTVSGLEKAGRYLVTIALQTKDLNLYDVENGTPKRVGTVQIPGGGSFRPRNVKVAGDIAYVAVEGDEGGLSSVNISDPKNPEFLETISDSPNLRGLDVEGKYAYMTGVSANGIRVFDVSNPADIQPVVNITHNISTGQEVLYQDGTLFVADYSENRVLAFDVTNPENPQYVSNITDTDLAGASDMEIRGNTLYIVGEQADSLVALNIANTSDITKIGSVTSASNLDAAAKLDVVGDVAYVAAYSANALTQVDISDPKNMEVTNTVSTTETAGAYGVVADEQHVYVAGLSADAIAVFQTQNARIPNLDAGALTTDKATVESRLYVDGELISQGAAMLGGGLTVDGETVLRNTVEVESDLCLGGVCRNTWGNATANTGWSSDGTTTTTSQNVNVNSGNLFINTTTGRIGVGTTSPSGDLEISDTSGTQTLVLDAPGAGSAALTLRAFDGSDRIEFDSESYDRYYFQTTGDTRLFINDDQTGNGEIGINTENPQNPLSVSGDTDITGRLGIGKQNPSQKLDVNGSANITGNIFYGGNLTSYSADLAEYFNAEEDLESGTVVVVDPDRDEAIKKSEEPYDTTVAGIISTDPAHSLGYGQGNAQLALAGRVPVKITESNGAIQRGDLLTTSTEPGKAMRCVDRTKCVGAILGKALTESQGTNQVIALVTLQ